MPLYVDLCIFANLKFGQAKSYIISVLTKLPAIRERPK